MKNDGKPSRKRLGSVTEVPWLGFSSRKQFFHPKQLKCIARGVRDIWNSLPSLVYRKRGEEVVDQLAQVRWVASGSNPASKIFRKGTDSKFFKISIYTLLLISSPPFFRNLRKSYGSLTDYATMLVFLSVML